MAESSDGKKARISEPSGGYLALNGCGNVLEIRKPDCV